MYVLNATECIADCSVVIYCDTCQISQMPSEYVECLTCSNGYSVDNVNNTCVPVCGDGLFAPEEICEDNNTENGDGCDFECQK